MTGKERESLASIFKQVQDGDKERYELRVALAQIREILNSHTCSRPQRRDDINKAFHIANNALNDAR